MPLLRWLLTAGVVIAAFLVGRTGAQREAVEETAQSRPAMEAALAEQLHFCRAQTAATLEQINRRLAELAHQRPVQDKQLLIIQAIVREDDGLAGGVVCCSELDKILHKIQRDREQQSLTVSEAETRYLEARLRQVQRQGQVLQACLRDPAQVPARQAELLELPPEREERLTLEARWRGAKVRLAELRLKSTQLIVKEDGLAWPAVTPQDKEYHRLELRLAEAEWQACQAARETVERERTASKREALR
jgi:hypothetical protein